MMWCDCNQCCHQFRNFRLKINLGDINGFIMVQKMLQCFVRRKQKEMPLSLIQMDIWHTFKRKTHAIVRQNLTFTVVNCKTMEVLIWMNSGSPVEIIVQPAIKIHRIFLCAGIQDSLAWDKGIHILFSKISHWATFHLQYIPKGGSSREMKLLHLLELQLLLCKTLIILYMTTLCLMFLEHSS